MAVIADNSTSWIKNSATSFSESYTVGASGKYIKVDISVESNLTIAITYNGVTVPLLVKDNVSAIYCYTFGLLSPATGANTLSITWGGGSFDFSIGVSSWNGVGSERTIASNNSSGSPATVTPTSSSGDMLVDSFFYYSNRKPVTANGAQTVLFQDIENNQGDNIGSSYRTSAGNSQLSWTTNDGGGYILCGLPLVPAATDVYGWDYPSPNPIFQRPEVVGY